MNIKDLKIRILDDNKTEYILEAIGCHHIKVHNSNEYITCGNPDGGDNPCAITLYLNENLTCINYTRNILSANQTRTTDIFDLIMWAKETDFFHAVQWVCTICGLDYYTDEEEIPESLQVLQFLSQMNKENCDDDIDYSPLKPIDPSVLNYYMPVGNILFEKDGISLSTQRFFEVGYDQQTNRLTIPIYSEIGHLVGVKGRLFQEEIEEGQNKYLYLFNCNKGKILYGLNKNLDAIMQQGKVYVVESEKAVMQLYDMGYYGVATGGSKITKYQVSMLTRLGVQIVIAYDKDIDEDELHKIADQFVDGVPVYAIIDRDGLLGEKESPSDNSDKWRNLVRTNVYKLR